MLYLVVLVMLIGAMLALVLFGEGEHILGLDPSMFASLVSILAFGVLVLGWGAAEFRGKWRQAARDAALWLLILLGLVTAYAYRFELQVVANRVLAEIAPGHVVMARGGEVIVARAGPGSFVLAGRVNGRDARFLFDTGATMVMLTDTTARAAGLEPAKLSYNVNVITANGRTTAAQVRLDRVTIGSIVETRVDALVARPGTLSDNLLGMSFLERLASYEVRDDKLIMRGGR
jgi:aspartyl protease family protein